MEKFFVDTHFGVSIWIDTDSGVINRFHGPENESLLKGLEKHYKGKGIQFFAEDFMNTMHPSWHLVKSQSLTHLLCERSAIISHIRFYHSKLNPGIYYITTRLNPSQVAAYELQLQKYQTELNSMDSKIALEINRLKEESGFDWEKIKQLNLSLIEKRGF